MKYQDYYDTLGVNRSASTEEISRAYKKLARKCHPDINKAEDAEEKFKQINEAHEVLKDPEKRKMYDALGHNWKNGQEFRPPPNWEEMFGQNFGGASSTGFNFGTGGGGFSDFFESLFGGGGASSIFGNMGGQGSGYSTGARAARKPQPLNTELGVSLYEALNGSTKQIAFTITQTAPDGSQSQFPKKYSVKIPAGTEDGHKIRLKGQAPATASGAQPGDIIIKINVLPDPRFKIEKRNLVTKAEVQPWIAALGGSINVPLLSGSINLKVPAGSNSGTRLRIKGKGYPASKGKPAGDLFVELKIVVPKHLTQEEKRIYEELRALSEVETGKVENG